jgi:hypothetical protein
LGLNDKWKKIIVAILYVAIWIIISFYSNVEGKQSHLVIGFAMLAIAILIGIEMNWYWKKYRFWARLTNIVLCFATILMSIALISGKISDFAPVVASINGNGLVILFGCGVTQLVKWILKRSNKS